MTLNKIIIHWTAGGSIPNDVDRNHYHYMIDSQGQLHSGKHKPEDNINCNDGKYAAHTGGGNTGAIGVALCGMLGFKDKNNVGRFPLTQKQVESALYFIAGLSLKYKIPVTPQSIMTHYEFGKANPKTSSAGKIDIIYLPPYPDVPADKIGDFLRGKIKWYQEKIKKGK